MPSLPNSWCTPAKEVLAVDVSAAKLLLPVTELCVVIERLPAHPTSNAR